MTEVVQPVTFVVDARPQNRERWITISAVDAGALMQQLPAAIEITARIAKASSFDLRGESGGKNVDVGIGEDQLLLDALARMERRGPLSAELARLRKELEARIVREPKVTLG